MRSLFEKSNSKSCKQLRRQCSLLLRLGLMLRSADESLPVGKMPLLRPWCIRVQSLQPATSAAGGGGTGAFASNDDRNSAIYIVFPTCNACHGSLNCEPYLDSYSSCWHDISSSAVDDTVSLIWKQYSWSDYFDSPTTFRKHTVRTPAL